MIDKSATLFKHFERIVGHAPLSGEVADALAAITEWAYSSFLAEGAPKQVERDMLPWDKHVMSVIDTMGRHSSIAGRRYVREDGPAPLPEILKGVAQRKDRTKMITEADVDRAAGRLFGSDNPYGVDFTPEEIAEFAGRVFGGHLLRGTGPKVIDLDETRRRLFGEE